MKKIIHIFISLSLILTPQYGFSTLEINEDYTVWIDDLTGDRFVIETDQFYHLLSQELNTPRFYRTADIGGGILLFIFSTIILSIAETKRAREECRVTCNWDKKYQKPFEKQCRAYTNKKQCTINKCREDCKKSFGIGFKFKF